MGCRVSSTRQISGGLPRLRPNPVAKSGEVGKTDGWMRFKRTSDLPLYRKARRGFRGYPIATIALYGPDDKLATKIAVAIVTEQDAGPAALDRWFSDGKDVRSDLVISSEVLKFIKDHGAKSVVLTDRIIGCPHEEGVDYPEGAVCPQCPFWARRDRWSGELIQ
jgi:hypothetical protein